MNSTLPTEKNTLKVSEYAAFISYQHMPQDRQWAEWLVEALETYRTPKHLQNLGYPQRIGKVFRDDDELSLGSDLTDKIKQALAASRNLIVVCSPETPKSKRIAQEIELFKAMGKAERIYAFLIAGEPSESFPENLTHHQKTITAPDGTVIFIIEEREPLAANVIPITGISKKDRDKSALFRLIATVIGCSYDDLVQRDRMREKKKQNILRAIIFSVLLLISGGGLYWWDYTRLKTSYYEHMMTRWAAPQGVYPVTAEQASKRYQTFRFESRRNQVERVVLQNGVGLPRNNDDEFSQWKGSSQWHFFYDAAGKVRQVDVLNQTGKRLRQEDYSPNLRSISFKNDNRDIAQVSAISTTIIDSSQKAKSEITRHKVEYREDGFIIQRRFTNNYSTPKSNETGAYGSVYELSQNGLIVRESYFDQAGKAFFLKNGISAIDHQIDLKTGRTDSITYRDKHNKAISGNKGYAKFTQLYDNRGNLTEESYFDVNGEPVRHKDGYAKFTQTYDERGNVIEAATFGFDSKPVLSKDSVAKFTRVYDERGNVTESATFGVDGKPVLHKDGYAKFTQVYDERSNVTETAYFGVDGKLALNKDGYAKFTQTYDERDNVTEIAYFGVNGKPALHKVGYAKFTQAFDDRGNVTEQTYFDLHGKPALHKDGYAKFTQAFDDRGNVTEQIYFDLHGKPALHKDGYAKFTQTHDERDNATEIAYFGVDGKPALHKDGYAKFTQTYDERGNSKEVAYFGINGKPALHKDGYAKFTQTYDERGNVTETAYLGVNDKPALHKDGYAKFTQTYDERGNTTEEAYFGINDKPILHKDGYAKITLTYDERGNAKEVASFGVNGKLLRRMKLP